MDATKVALGVCTVTFDALNLGHTKGGVEVTYEPVWHDVTVDLYGESKVDKRLMGEHITAKVPLAEYTVANLGIAIPAGTIVTNATTPSKKRLDVGSNAGVKASSKAAPLVLTPVDAVGSEHTVTIPKAVAGNEIVLSHVNDAERVIEVEFNGLIDESKAAGKKLFSIGDPTA